MVTKRDGRTPSQRQLRVGEELRHALVDILRRGDFRDPELQDLNVTVTEVRVSPDLRNATVFVTPLGGGHADEAVAALRRAAPYFRAQLAHAINLRYAPRVSFEADTSFDYAGRINNLLHDPEVQRDLAARHDDDSDADDDDRPDEQPDVEDDAGPEGDDPAAGRRHGP